MTREVFHFRSRVLSTVICSILAFQPLSWARAGTPQGPNQGPTLRVSVGLPYDGYLDRYHRAQDLVDRPITASLYAIRTTVVEDLVQTRLGLMRLLGDSRLDYTVPRSVKDLYDVPSESTQESHREITEITEVVETLESSRLSGRPIGIDSELRKKLLQGLIYHSALLVNADRILNYLHEDWYTADQISPQFFREVTAPFLRLVNPTVHDRRFINFERQARDRWKQEHQVEDDLAIWAGWRDQILSLYPILSVEVYDKPLYRQLYDSMSERGYFPKAESKLVPEIPELPGKGESIPLPGKQLQSVMESAQFIYRALSSQSYAATSRFIHAALIKSLKANTEMLVQLTEDPEFSRKMNSPLVEMGAIWTLWPTMKMRFSHLKSFVDFDTAEASLKEQVEQVDRKRDTVRTIAYAAGTTVGLLALATGVGLIAGGTLYGFSGATLGLFSGGIFAAHSVYAYLNAKKRAEVRQNLFLGELVQGSVGYRDMADAVMIQQEDFRTMVLSGLLAGYELPLFSLLAKARTVVQGSGVRFVRLSKSEFETVRRSVIKMSARGIERSVPMGSRLLSRMKRVLGIKDPAKTVMPLEQAIAEVAKTTGQSSSSILAKLEKIPGFGGLIRGWKHRVETTPGFVRMVITDEVLGVTVSAVSDIAGRGHVDWQNLGLHVATGMVIDFALIWKLAGSVSRVRLAANPTLRDHFSHYDQLVRENALTFAAVGVAAGVGTTGTAHLQQYLENPDAMSIEDRVTDTVVQGLVWGSILGSSSPLRYGVTQKYNLMIEKRLQDGIIKKLSLAPVSFGNLLVGGFQWVKTGQLLGLDESKQEIDLSDLSGSNTQGEPVYIKVSPGSDPVERMFDFLRAG